MFGEISLYRVTKFDGTFSHRLNHNSSTQSFKIGQKCDQGIGVIERIGKEDVDLARGNTGVIRRNPAELDIKMRGK